MFIGFYFPKVGTIYNVQYKRTRITTEAFSMRETMHQAPCQAEIFQLSKTYKPTTANISRVGCIKISFII